jgi:hypothetical protein
MTQAVAISITVKMRFMITTPLPFASQSTQYIRRDTRPGTQLIAGQLCVVLQQNGSTGSKMNTITMLARHATRRPSMHAFTPNAMPAQQRATPASPGLE